MKNTWKDISTELEQEQGAKAPCPELSAKPAERPAGRMPGTSAEGRQPKDSAPDLLSAQGALNRSGGHSARETPDPIPNSAVKPRRADGTASQDVGE